ncbi:MAG: PAS domain S-box protein [Bacteroidia bacterium]|nr:PAS domain S-box protein [Bacteroidia bacterium]
MKDKIKKILAIDDIEDNLIVLKALLIEAFPTIKFISATSGREGLVLCRNHRPDVVLLDIVMPGMNGYEVCTTIKSDKFIKHIPVVMVTAAKTDRECRIKALECGADAFLAKPLDKSELTAQIRAMLRIKEAVDRKRNEKKRLEELVKLRTRNLEIELRQRKRTEKELKVAFEELDQRRKTQSALFEELKAQVQVRREAELSLMQSRKAFQNYFENCSVGMSVTSPGKIWLEVNQVLCQMLGYSKEELKGLTWIDLTYPEDVEKNLGLFTEMSEGRLDRYEIDKRFVRKDGSLIYITLSVVCERNPDGSLHHLLTSYVDITARHKAEEVIIQERSLLRTLIDNLPDSIFVKDTLCRKIVANKADLGHMGYASESEIIGKTDIELFPAPEGIDGFQEDLSVILTGIPLINRETYSIDSNGKQYWRLSSKIPFYDENRKVQGLVGIGYDITERKLIEEALTTSEELYRNLVDKMPDGVYKSTFDGKFVSANPALVTMLGYDSKEEMMAINIKNELYFDTEERNRLVSNKKEGGIAVFRLKRKDGSVIWVEDHSWFNTDEKGDILYHVGILRDVTDRMRVEGELRVLSRAVEQNPASIVITDTMGQIEYVNPKFTELTGYSFNEVLGENPRILKSGSTSSSEYTDMWNTILAGGEWHGQFKNKKKGGEEYFEDALISPIKDENGNITHFLAVKEDITGQKKDEILIRKLSKAIGQSPVSTIITDANGNIEFVNNAFTTLTQYTIEEVIKKTPRIFNRGHIPGTDFDFMWENLKAGKVWKCEYQNRRKDRSVYWEDVTISSLMNSEGAISNYILIMDDISEKKNMLDDLITAKEIAEETNRLKSAFLATMNHELRTPLNHILGFSEMILTGADPEENITFASSIQTSGQSLLSIIEGVFDLALVEHTNIQLRKQTFSLIDQFMENKASFDNILRTSAKQEQIQLIFKPDTRWLSSYVTADRSKINQVLTNLFKNAVKFTHKGTIEFGYTIEHESNLVFYIKDSGIGIPLEKQSIIFDYFRQGDDSFTRTYGGIGIGLAISQKIAKILNGELKVVSEPGKGSTFSLSIPVELSEIKE